MKIILRSLLQCPQRQTFNFITYHILHSLSFRPRKITLRTRKTRSQLHWCSLIIPAFVWAEGGGSICQPPPLSVELACSFFSVAIMFLGFMPFHIAGTRYYAISSFHQGLAFICRFVIHSLGFCFEVQILIKPSRFKLINTNVYFPL